MSAIASKITSLTIVYSSVYSGADQRKHQNSTSLAFVWGIHRWPMNSPHKGPVTRKMFPFDDVIMNTIDSDTLISSYNWLIEHSWFHLLLYFRWATISLDGEYTFYTTIITSNADSVPILTALPRSYSKVINYHTLNINRGPLFSKNTLSYWFRDTHWKLETVFANRLRFTMVILLPIRRHHFENSLLSQDRYYCKIYRQNMQAVSAWRYTLIPGLMIL